MAYRAIDITSDVATVSDNYSYRFGRMAVIHCALQMKSDRTAWTAIATMGINWAADQAVLPFYGQTPNMSYIYTGKNSGSIYTSIALTSGQIVRFCGTVILL